MSLRMRYIIPQAIEYFANANREAAEACYLAGELNKKDFKRKYKECSNINFVAVIREIVDLVSADHRPPEGSLPWVLAKRMIIGVLRVRIYILDDAIASADRALKNAEPPVLNKLNEPEPFPEPPKEPPAVPPVFMDPDNLPPHIAPRDVHQIDEFDPILTREEENSLHFGSLTSEELSTFSSDDWGKELSDRERNMEQGGLLGCPNPIPGTPKRKAPGDGDSPPPPGTPSKRLRRNLEDAFPDGPRQDVPENEGLDGVGPPPHDDTDPQAQPIPGEAQPGEPPVGPGDDQPPQDDPQPPPEHSPPAQPPASPVVPPASPRLPPSPRVPRDRPIVLNPDNLRRREENPDVDGRVFDERVPDMRAVENAGNVLFRDPGIIRLDPEVVNLLEERAEAYFDDVRYVPPEEVEFEISLYRAEETIQNILDLTAGAEPQRDVPQAGPEESGAGQEVPEEEPVHVSPHLSPQAAPPAEEEGPAIPRVNTPLREPDNAPIQDPHPDQIPEGPEFEFRTPHQSRSTSSRAMTTTATHDDTNEAYTPQDGLTRRQFFARLDAAWEDARVRYNLDHPPPVDYDDVMDPRENTRVDYSLGLSYAMEGMIKKKLLMQQSAPYGIVWLLIAI